MMGREDVSSQDFRRACSLFATGVTVVTTAHGKVRLGMTVNSFASLSLDPPLVLWSLREASGARAVFEQSGRFCVNVLAADQGALAMRFARKPDADPFEGSCHPFLDGEPPRLTGALAHIDCEITEILPQGDHAILIGRVRDLSHRSGAPLLFFAGNLSAGPGPVVENA